MAAFKTLTKVEEQLMQALWEIGKGTTKDIIDRLPQPKPHYNTAGTILKILLEKGFVQVTAVGKTHLYSPVVTKESYSRKSVQQLVKGYFGGSFANMLSFFAKEQDISVSDLEQILKDLKK